MSAVKQEAAAWPDQVELSEGTSRLVVASNRRQPNLVRDAASDPEPVAFYFHDIDR